MSLKTLIAKSALGAATLGLVACGGPVGNGPNGPNASQATPDGNEKDRNLEGKGDAWNWLNSPDRFRTELNYNWEELKSEAPEGYTENEVWPDTYWPTYEDSINARWQGEDTLSPVEKYDKAFNDWEPEGGFEEFMSLQPYDTDTCEWDEAYYEKLGPAATKVAKNDGNWEAHNGVDDDGDGVPDKEECGYGEDKDYDGIETWWGLCHAWVPAAILNEEPKEPVTVEGSNGEDVTFDVADIKALLVNKYDRSDAYMVGGRCNNNGNDIERSDSGRIPDDKCRDVNAGSFHVLLTNVLGIQGRPLAEDRTYDYEVWNQPIIGYKITKQEKIGLEEVQNLLNTSDERDESAQPESEEEKTQVLMAANTLSKTELVEEAGLRTEKAETLVGYRDENGDLQDVGAIEEEVGTRAVARLLTYAYESGMLEEEPAIYSYNENADSFVEVEMSVDYVTESHASTEPKFEEIERFTRTDNYHYILELDENGKIIGGEWVGRSIEKHPDFLWLPTGPGGGNSEIDLAKVRDLLAKSTGSSSSTEEESQTESYSSSETIAIPDNNPEGASSTISVDAEGNVSGVTLNLEIEHTYRGDLVVVLEKDGTKVTVYDGKNADQGWQDDLSLTGEQVDGFGGLSVSGDWTLKVVDTMDRDTGELKEWSFKPRLE